MPQRAVQQGSKGSVVFVVAANDKVEVRDVQASSWKGNQWLIEKGLHAGERVVVDGVQRIIPGAQVKPVPFENAGTVPAGEAPVAKKEEAK